MDFFVQHMNFCEMDMNMLSPITWSLNLKCYKSAKLYTSMLKNFALISGDKQIMREHAPIFFGAVKHLIKV